MVLNPGESSHHPVKSFKDILQGSSAPESVNIKYEQGFAHGAPALFISDADMVTLDKPFDLTLVGKFSSTHPPLVSIRKFVSRMKFKGNVLVDVHDNLNVVFRFGEEDDYNRFFLYRYYTVFGVTMKVIKWSPFVNISEELPIVPLWISFPGLRLQLFDKTTLWNLGKMFGKPLSVDASTAVCGNISKARILVETDVTKTIPNKIWLGSIEWGFFQSVIVENKPLYCEKCKLFGHEGPNCSFDPLNAPVNEHSPGVMEGSNCESNPPGILPLPITMGNEEVTVACTLRPALSDKVDGGEARMDEHGGSQDLPPISQVGNKKSKEIKIEVLHAVENGRNYRDENNSSFPQSTGVGKDAVTEDHTGVLAFSAKHTLVDVHSKELQGKPSDPVMYENENLGENLGVRNNVDVNVEVEDTSSCKTGWESGGEIPPLSPQDAIDGGTSVVVCNLIHGYPSSGITTRAMAKMGGAKKEQAWGRFWQQSKKHKGKKKATNAMAIVRDALINPPDFYA